MPLKLQEKSQRCNDTPVSIPATEQEEKVPSTFNRMKLLYEQAAPPRRQYLLGGAFCMQVMIQGAAVSTVWMGKVTLQFPWMLPEEVTNSPYNS